MPLGLNSLLSHIVFGENTMNGKNMLEGRTGPITQSVDAVKVLLTWKGHPINPLPADVSLDNGRLVLVLSNKKDVFYTVTPTKRSCPAATYHPGQPCKHQRKHFPGPQKSREVLEAEGDSILAAQNGPRRLAKPPEESSIRPECKWPGGLNGPVDEPIKAVV
jgi:hypothetical protein